MEVGSEKGRKGNRRERRVEFWLKLTGRLDGGSRRKKVLKLLLSELEFPWRSLRRRYDDDKYNVR
jgi:hypothetical protein